MKPHLFFVFFIRLNLLLTLLFYFSIIPIFSQTWQSVGPHELPSNAGGGSARGLGRVNVIRFHPDYNGTSNEIIFAGSSRSEVWKTINACDNLTNMFSYGLYVTFTVNYITICNSDTFCYIYNHFC